MIKFYPYFFVLIFAFWITVYSENSFPDFENPLEISKIKEDSIIGRWTELTNKSLPFDEFRQKNGLQFLRTDDKPYTGYYLQEDKNEKIRNLRYFKEGILNGPLVSWRENGMISYKGFYKNGKKHGLHQYWSERNSKTLEQNFRDGKLDGVSIRWYQDGVKSSEQIFQNGKILTAIGWKPDGERCPSTRVIDGIGVMVLYDNFGTETKREKFENKGKELSVERYENGNIREEGYYKNGNKDGLWIFYSIDGTEHFRIIYREGVRLKTEFSSNPLQRKKL